MATRWWTVDGVRLHGRIATVAAPVDAPDVVLVHGLGVSSRYFAPLVTALAGSARVAAPELPGTGRSDKPARPLDVDELAAALASWWDVAVGAPGIVVAHSLGCQVAVAMAVHHPGRASHLVLVGPTMDPDALTVRGQLGRFLRIVRHESIRQLPLVVRDYIEARPWRMLATLRAALRNRIEDALPDVDITTLVVRGEHDAIAPQGWAEEVARLLPAGRLAVVAGHAHAVTFTAPDAMAGLVLHIAGGMYDALSARGDPSWGS